MTAEKWLKFSVPIQGLLLLSQLATGLNYASIPWSVYQVVHLGGGILLAVLVFIHVLINRDWLQKAYRRRMAPHK